ncbi:cytochrome c oxidase subunit II [Rhizobium pusense]|uniref:cytochrome c oxidase subunit II n=1 Tax=Agrobacterium pusense TaxID=648995 RepID=UPI000D19B7D6|nr:cytochrome c oxidase subunit II [Agrobacterium pusense]MDH0911750.1 cytochrome c oxidase subunit II [Agrobacterium pusense]MDH1097821.1 cytochrome c oxidase subunit II [Agrobacterium pusense]MDH1114242.1 cytochrome c oxidase subunit II [Agrobacterium pusense]MDH2196380.1 cytochrome c oxidase subunit II [Agrobacterium pusense]
MLYDREQPGNTVLAPAWIIALTIPSGCSGRQSALAPAGDEAEAIFQLFLVMVVGGTLLWIFVAGLLVLAERRRAQPWSKESAGRLIAWGGVAFPLVILFALLTYTVWLMPGIRPWLSRSTAAEATIEVIGERFWWRIRYPPASGIAAFETANELRLPVGQRTVFSLKAADVIHSFWIPALGGKMDMIPGRTNTVSLLPTKTGVFRAPCAEFCGTSHALMAFSVIVMEPEAYVAWRRAQAGGDQRDRSEGERLFDHHGCVGCHGIRGVTPPGSIGPDLTLFGTRLTLGAGTLANTGDNVARFIRDPAAIKPEAKMPAFGMLPDEDIAAIAAYLTELK